jgi:A/G-specific adenine glycosylase
MLQQTTVATVTPRYQAFLEHWPTVFDMAASPQEDVLEQWAGLGYYARARNLHKCAQVVAEEHDGVFPSAAEELQKLPGIGPYTAAAMAAIAFDQPAVVMDGNIERVMARLFAVETPLPVAKPVLFEHAASQTPAKRPGDHAQALMDLGATLCTPRNPVCSLCPLNKECLGFEKGVAADLPYKKKKTAKPTRQGTVFYLQRKSDGAVLLVRRPEKGLLGGMLALPSTDWGEVVEVIPPAKTKWEEVPGVVRHTFTHFHLELSVWCGVISDRAAAKLDGEWRKEPLSAGLPTVFKKAVAHALPE